MRSKSILLAITGLFVIASVAQADVIVYPKKGQSNEQMEKDKYECYSWAKGTTGFDPMVTPTASTPPPSNQQKSGGVVRGAAIGAAAGAIFGNSSKNTRNSAYAGAAIGGLRQRSQNQQSAQQRADWERNETNRYANARNEYNRAYSACLDGRGYSVK
ncbi:MAG TPA: hypothetical protein ENI64_13050 [Gammaproteobacteria bacterium]|nr:hypothetical protein [Gammaproteobacteria bacterium]